ncbi:hypothetical protein FRACYDRAFT_241110 [Fragilariopsis cylindrus CCMP1102]|uniref:Uncharacterized protein n=1 Tax=Fragilariopsis cylindrus CCMP1102 TaxID=635003 RepID=A0A1E7F8Q5_9STRA|nr:hypothetical protein FRACYDRAFT_241110 [Fragilariopsis cylindrus CCMP1102]|eukprot:OEU14562.1 hypothetical protein FRACYDRAFT_241110 [Fragilariopsis cylindrus CCMP1102]
MKFSTSSFVSLATLFLVGSMVTTTTTAQSATASPQPVVEEKESIDLYELRTVGEVGSGKKPVGQIMTLEPFFGFAYFEAHPSQLAPGNIHVELFAGAVIGEPCDSGVLLESTAGNQITTDSFPDSTYNKQFEDLDGISYPATSNGEVVAAVFIIGDFRLPNGDQQIYFPNKGEKDGQIELCVRMALKVDYDGDSIEDYVGFVDTYFDVAVDLTANTATFWNNKVYEVLEVPSYLETDVNATITMNSYICDDENVEVDRPVFGPGEAFSICVGPADDDNYSVEDYLTLICKNEGETRHLVKNYVPDVLTTVDSEADEDGVRAVRSVVTPGFIDQGENKFFCEGEVSLSYDDEDEEGQGRRRTITKRFHATSPSYSNGNDNDNGRKDDSPRTLLYSEESSSPFQTIVNLSSYQVQDEDDKKIGFILLIIFGILFGLLAGALCNQKVGTVIVKKDEEDEDVDEEKASVASVASVGGTEAISVDNNDEEQAADSQWKHEWIY